MKARADKLHRILALQQQLHRVEEWTAAELRQRVEELQREQRDMIGALNENEALQGLFMDAMVRRLRALAESEKAAELARESHAPRLIESATRLASAERLSDVVDEATARAAAKAELADIIDRHQSRIASD